MEEDLNLLECPFTWNVPEVSSREDFMDRLSNKEDQALFLMNGFCVNMVECFERARSGEIEVAIKKAKECEMTLKEYHPVGLFAKSNKYLLERSSEAMWHIILSTKAHLALHNGDLDAVDALQQRIPALVNMNNSNLAAINGIKSRFFMEYGPFETTSLANSFARNAIELDYTVPLWHFYLGKGLARHRRANNFLDKPSIEEITELEKAFSDCQAPDKGVMLLESYVELLKGRHQFDHKAIMIKCRQLLHDVKQSAGDEWYIYWRCAHLAIKLPSSVIKTEEIKCLINKTVDCSNRSHNTDLSFVYSVKHFYYLKKEKNNLKALEYAKKASKYGEKVCAKNVISLTYDLFREEDLIPTINRFINNEKICKNGKTKNQFILFKANYLFFEKKQIIEALKLYFILMEEDCNYYQLLNCEALFKENKNMNRFYSVYDRLIEELTSVICDSSTSKIDKDKYICYRSKVEEYKEKSGNGKKSLNTQSNVKKF